MQLIMLPYAGANRYSYNPYKPHFSDFAECHVVELPGRAARWREPLLTDMDTVMKDVINTVVPWLEKPYAIYGHSMGTLLATLLVGYIEENELPQPQHLFLTGCGSPTAPKRKEKKRHLMDDATFKKELLELGGCPKEVLENEELMNYFLPLLRADFQAIETYTYRPKKLSVPITAMVGTEEDITDLELSMWNEVTHASVETIRMTGNHFFIFDHVDSIAKTIRETLQLVETI